MTPEQLAEIRTVAAWYAADQPLPVTLREVDRLRALAEEWQAKALALDESAASWDCHAPAIAGKHRARASELRACARDVLGDRCHMCDVDGPCAAHAGARP